MEFRIADTFTDSLTKPNGGRAGRRRRPLSSTCRWTPRIPACNSTASIGARTSTSGRPASTETCASSSSGQRRASLILLHRPPRRRLPLGGAALHRAAPEDRRGPNSWKCGKPSAKSRCRRMSRPRRLRPRPSVRSSDTSPRTSCSSTASLPSGSTTCARRPRTRSSHLWDHLPAEAMEALLALATGEVPQLPLQTPEGTDPFAHPDAQRPLPCHGERGGVGARARIPMGEVDGLPAPDPAVHASSAGTTVRRAWPGRPERGRRSSPCTAPCTSHGRVQTPACS